MKRAFPTLLLWLIASVLLFFAVIFLMTYLGDGEPETVPVLGPLLEKASSAVQGLPAGTGAYQYELHSVHPSLRSGFLFDRSLGKLFEILPAVLLVVLPLGLSVFLAERRKGTRAASRSTGGAGAETGQTIGRAVLIAAVLATVFYVSGREWLVSGALERQEDRIFRTRRAEMIVEKARTMAPDQEELDMARFEYTELLPGGEWIEVETGQTGETEQTEQTTPAGQNAEAPQAEQNPQAGEGTQASTSTQAETGEETPAGEDTQASTSTQAGEDTQAEPGKETPAGEGTPPGEPGFDAPELLHLARQALTSGSYPQARYYALLAQRMADRPAQHKEAQTIAERAAELTPTRQALNALDREYAAKLNARTLLERGRPLEAYYAFRRFPDDRDVLPFLREAEESFLEYGFFQETMQDAVRAAGDWARREVVFTNTPQELIYLGNLTKTGRGWYARDVSILQFDGEGEIAGKISAEYAHIPARKNSLPEAENQRAQGQAATEQANGAPAAEDRTAADQAGTERGAGLPLQLYCVAAEDPDLRFEPVRSQGRQSSSLAPAESVFTLYNRPEELAGLSRLQAGLQTAPLSTLWNLRKSIDRLGYRHEPVYTELFRRLSGSFGFFLLALFLPNIAMRLAPHRKTILLIGGLLLVFPIVWILGAYSSVFSALGEIFFGKWGPFWGIAAFIGIQALLAFLAVVRIISAGKAYRTS
ncbi:MAG: LptF/LptG family permease [Spirochaetales bacterium]|nr:LptF/LptG family permease [Spirochaetales bacterium]MCF7937730.1 LptF/LptG family permease [Spirochaetales bacterium]